MLACSFFFRLDVLRLGFKRRRMRACLHNVDKSFERDHDFRVTVCAK